jgi:hypothetical protein
MPEFFWQQATFPSPCGEYVMSKLLKWYLIWVETSQSSVSIPLRGICNVKFFNQLRTGENHRVSIPLRGICNVKFSKHRRLFPDLERFHPLAGNM